jgi:hypothetical protein
METPFPSTDVIEKVPVPAAAEGTHTALVQEFPATQSLSVAHPATQIDPEHVAPEPQSEAVEQADPSAIVFGEHAATVPTRRSNNLVLSISTL